MNFDLTEEQLMLQDTLGQLLSNECPVLRVREVFDGDTGFDPALWKGLVELGIAGLNIPEQYGGAGLEILDLALAAETLGFHAAPGPFLGHALAAIAIHTAGSDEQKERWLPGLATGDLLGTVALADVGGRWQPDRWQIATGRSITGRKEYVPQAEKADLFVVGLRGGRLGVVEKGASGITDEIVDGADLSRRLRHMDFDATPCELLADDAEAARRVRDVGLVLLAADAFGGAQPAKIGPVVKPRSHIQNRLLADGPDVPRGQRQKIISPIRCSG